MNVPSAPVKEYDHSFIAGGVVYRKARLEDDEALRGLLRNNAMDSWVRVSMEREPSFFLGEHLMGESVAVVLQREDPPQEFMGMYSMATHPVHINGVPCEAGYMGALRIDPRHRHKIRILRNGCESIQALSAISGLPLYTSLASENNTARRLLEANLRGMPRYALIGEMESLAISTRQGKDHGLLRPAQAKDIPDLVEFFNTQAAAYQFSTVLDEQWLRNSAGTFGLSIRDFLLLEDEGTLRGCVAIWDQRGFKQVVVRGYRFPLHLLRASYNLYARMAGRLALPRRGQQLEQVFLSFLALDSRAQDILPRFIAEALFHARLKGAKAGVLGLSIENPLHRHAKKHFNPSVYRTCIETFTLPGSPEPQLDRRPPQPEIGLL